MVVQETISIRSSSRVELIDVTGPVRKIVRDSGVTTGFCHVFVAGATAAVIVNENDDPQLLDDYLDALDRLVPEGQWRHDRIDNNGAAHIKSATVGPAEVLPVSSGDLALGTWQNIFLCEFDGPRASRRLVVTVHGD